MAFDTGYCRMAFDDNDVVKYTHSAATYAWTPVYIPGQGVMIPTASYSANVVGSYRKRGILNFIVASAVTVTAGDRVYYNSTDGVIQNTVPEAGFLIGTALETGTGTSTGTVAVNIDLNTFGEDGLINVYSSSGKFKASYATIDLAVAALANDDIIKIKAGSYTLTDEVDITKTGVKIFGEPGTVIVGASGADYCLKTVLGAITSTKELTIENITFDHSDDATQAGLVIDNVSATGRINVYLKNVSGESDGGNTITVTHTATAAAIRLYVEGGTFEGPVNFVVGNTDDRIRFEGSTLRGGLVTGTSATAMEIELWNCKVLHQGVTGGNAAQLVYALYCLSETDANPNVYAALDTSDLAGSHTETVLFPVS